MRHHAAALAVAALVASGCSSSLDLASITGLWVGPPGVGSSSATDLQLVVSYEGSVEEGCWSAEGPAGLLPVRWPAGTVVGLEAVLELGEVVVTDGDTVTARGVVASGAIPAADLGQGLPAGCDVADGYYAVEDVSGA